MRKPIFENEKHFDEFCEHMGIIHQSRKDTIETLYKSGYIKKSALKIAEERFNNAFNNSSFQKEDTYLLLLSYCKELDKDREKLLQEIKSLKGEF